MSRIEFKATEPFELLEMNTERKTAVIAHCAYDNIDKAGDISRKGMFNKSWKENKAIDFLIDHDPGQKPGLVTKTYEDEKKAYTGVKFGSHTLGNDTMLMMDEGIITGASFGFYTIKANKIEVKARKVRELKEVLHKETTVAYKLSPVNDAAGVVMVTKAGDIAYDLSALEFKSLSATEFDILKQLAASDQQALELMVRLSGSVGKESDLYNWILYQISRRADFADSIRSQIKYNSGEMKAMAEHLQKMESFCRTTTASDDCIASVARRIDETKAILSQYDTAYTGLINQPDASRTDNDTFIKKLLLTYSNF